MALEELVDEAGSLERYAARANEKAWLVDQG